MNVTSAARPFTIASYNVKNLFDDIDDPNKKDEGTPAKPEDSQAALSKIMQASEADVIALQEVENIDILTSFRDNHGLSKLYPHVVLLEGNDNRGIDVALLSKFPIQSPVSHKDETFPVKGQEEPGKFLRDVLQADVEMPGKIPVRIFVTHLASKIGGERAERQREAEAVAARDIIKRETADFPSQKYVVLGDFNDSPDSKTVQTFLEPDSSGWALKDAFADDPEAKSYPTSKKTAAKWGYQKIDQILVSPALAEMVTDTQVHHHPKDELASDHWMVSATFG